MRLRRTLTVLATVTTLTLGGAATASAATARLSIAYAGCQGGDGRWYDYALRVQGTTGVGIYPNGHRVSVYLKGSDPWFDDDLAGPWSQDYPDEFNWSYSITFCVNSSTLDEDIGEDEVYAAVRVYDRASGLLREKVNSNQIHGYF